MIHIEYCQGEMVQCCWEIRDAMVGETVYHMIQYFQGKAKPNHPMPATIHAAEFYASETEFHGLFIFDVQEYVEDEKSVWQYP